jgi:hypothetical protein
LIGRRGVNGGSEPAAGSSVGMRAKHRLKKLHLRKKNMKDSKGRVCTAREN